jgi:two-component system, NtrC family, sensor kinase
VAPIYRAAVAYARLAETIASALGCCDRDQAWVGGLLAPLGWLAAATQPDGAQAALATLNTDSPPTLTQRRLWGLDASAIARRLCGAWRLPAWLAATSGGLDLKFDVARNLGAEPDHFLVVQLAVHLVNRQGSGLALSVGTPFSELCRLLDVAPPLIAEWTEELSRPASLPVPPQHWKSPAALALLPELLQQALDQRRCDQNAIRGALQQQVDALHEALQGQQTSEEKRLHERKLRALAEMAAGAGHEINNPLAVISGQAQYLLISEQEPARRKALQTIVSQAQRIHETLTGLMHFARPTLPRKQCVDLGGLCSDVLASLKTLADDRQVALQPPTLPVPLTLLVDPMQVRMALTAMLRNGIEAAPPGGWTALRVERRNEQLALVVEDSGPGLSESDREHLFDPFYCGRKAGRGRGLGLPAAWQIARHHGGDLACDVSSEGPTRFALTLPNAAIAGEPSHSPERNGATDVLATAQSA